MTGLLYGQGPPDAKPKTNWSADKAAERVKRTKTKRRQHDQTIHAEVNAVAQQLWKSRIIAIDPGDIWNGVAIFTGGICQLTQELTPDEMLRLVDNAVTSSSVDVVVVEQFTLYPDKAAEQSGSEMLTAQHIGAIRWIIKKHNALVIDFAEANGGERIGQLDVVELILQAASIKVPTTSVLKHLGIKPISTKPSGRMHMRDSEVHGQHFILRGKGLIRGSEQNRVVD